MNSEKGESQVGGGAGKPGGFFMVPNEFIDGGHLGNIKTLNELRVLLVYARRQGGNGIAWPGPKSIADNLGQLDIAGVRKAIRELVAKGYIENVDNDPYRGGRETAKRRVIWNPPGVESTPGLILPRGEVHPGTRGRIDPIPGAKSTPAPGVESTPQSRTEKKNNEEKHNNNNTAGDAGDGLFISENERKASVVAALAMAGVKSPKKRNALAADRELTADIVKRAAAKYTAGEGKPDPGALLASDLSEPGSVSQYAAELRAEAEAAEVAEREHAERFAEDEARRFAADAAEAELIKHWEAEAKRYLATIPGLADRKAAMHKKYDATKMLTVQAMAGAFLEAMGVKSKESNPMWMKLSPDAFYTLACCKAQSQIDAERQASEGRKAAIKEMNAAYELVKSELIAKDCVPPEEEDCISSDYDQASEYAESRGWAWFRKLSKSDIPPIVSAAFEMIKNYVDYETDADDGATVGQ